MLSDNIPLSEDSFKSCFARSMAINSQYSVTKFKETLNGDRSDDVKSKDGIQAVVHQKKVKKEGINLRVIPN